MSDTAFVPAPPGLDVLAPPAGELHEHPGVEDAQLRWALLTRVAFRFFALSNNFRLVQGKFRWIQDVPYNR